MVSQDEMKVELYRKNSNGNWLFATLDQDDELALDSVELTLTMEDIYEEVL